MTESQKLTQTDFGRAFEWAVVQMLFIEFIDAHSLSS
jgi:hypothetical protein